MTIKFEVWCDLIHNKKQKVYFFKIETIQLVTDLTQYLYFDFVKSKGESSDKGTSTIRGLRFESTEFRASVSSGEYRTGHLQTGKWKGLSLLSGSRCPGCLFFDPFEGKGKEREK